MVQHDTHLFVVVVADVATVAVAGVAAIFQKVPGVWQKNIFFSIFLF